ncbi:hypothetical protein BLS_005678 [Venturia inaequalis]|nr:hypothetical protein BLS_005678 [Venturia inaequalis]
MMVASSKQSDHDGEPSRKRRRVSLQPIEHVEAKLDSPTTAPARPSIKTAAPAEAPAQADTAKTIQSDIETFARTLSAKVQRIEAEKQELVTKNNDLEKKVQELESQRKELELRKEETQAKLSKQKGARQKLPILIPEIETNLSERNKELEERNKEMSARLTEQQNELEEAQAFVFNMDNNATWAPIIQDSDIGEQLKKLETNVRKFCENHAEPWRHGAQAKYRYPVPKPIAKELWLRPIDGSPEGLTDKVLNKTEPWLILSAWMNSFFYWKIFANPFFFMNQLLMDLDKGKGPNTGFSHDLLMLFQELNKNGTTDHLRLRSDMIRSLFPRGESDEAEKMRGRTLTAVQNACHILAKEFLYGPAEKVMQLPLSNKKTGAFCELINKFGILSLELSIQRSQICIKRKVSLPLQFEYLHPDLEPNQLHEGELVEDPHGLDNWDIMLVTCPGLVLVGSSDGTDYEAIRVVKKAVVWMGEV